MSKTDLNIHDVEKLDRGLAYAEVCFETVRVINDEVFDWPCHMMRLIKGLDSFGILLSETDIQVIRTHLLSRAGEIGQDVLVRVTVTGGMAGRGLIRGVDQQADVYIQSTPYEPNDRKAMLTAVMWPFAISQKEAKFSSDYALSLRAMHKWKKQGMPENMLPLICKDGHILSTSMSNVFIYRNNKWHTPDESRGGILRGVIRKNLIADMSVEVSDCPECWLDDCEAIAITNSVLFIQPAVAVNGRKLDAEHHAFEELYRMIRDKAGVPAI